jgi:hypothetical protein
VGTAAPANCKKLRLDTLPIETGETVSPPSAGRIRSGVNPAKCPSTSGRHYRASPLILSLPNPVKPNDYRNKWGSESKRGNFLGCAVNSKPRLQCSK